MVASRRFNGLEFLFIMRPLYLFICLVDQNSSHFLSLIMKWQVIVFATVVIIKFIGLEKKVVFVKGTLASSIMRIDHITHPILRKRKLFPLTPVCLAVLSSTHLSHQSP
jgi:hypothetical protein